MTFGLLAWFIATHVRNMHEDRSRCTASLVMCRCFHVRPDTSCVGQMIVCHWGRDRFWRDYPATDAPRVRPKALRQAFAAETRGHTKITLLQWHVLEDISLVSHIESGHKSVFAPTFMQLVISARGHAIHFCYVRSALFVPMFNAKRANFTIADLLSQGNHSNLCMRMTRWIQLVCSALACDMADIFSTIGTARGQPSPITNAAFSVMSFVENIN